MAGLDQSRSIPPGLGLGLLPSMTKLGKGGGQPNQMRPLAGKK